MLPEQGNREVDIGSLVGAERMVIDGVGRMVVAGKELMMSDFGVNVKRAARHGLL